MELKISIFTIGTFLYYTQANGPLEIPPEVQERLRSVKTRADFEASFTVDRGEKLPGARNTVHTGDGAGFPGGMKSQLRPSAGNYRSSVDSEPEIFKVKTIELTAAVPPTALSIDGPDAEVITDPIQSEDTCLKMNVCVPVPIKREPLVYYFPQCIQLEQCLGACCDGQQQCHAQEEANVQVLDIAHNVKKHIKETPTRHLSYLCDGVHDLIAETRATQIIMESEDRLQESQMYRVKELDVMFSAHLVWRIDNYRFHLQEAKLGKRPTIFSPPFYTGKQGYKMAASAALNGDGSGKGEYMSLFLTILRSEWDSLLPWPFSCNVNFSILDQKTDISSRENITESFKPNTCKENRAFLGRPVGNRNPSFGIQKFVRIVKLQAGDFIKDDTMFVKVDVDCSDVTPI